MAGVSHYDTTQTVGISKVPLGATDPEGGLLQGTKTVQLFRTQFYTIISRKS